MVHDPFAASLEAKTLVRGKTGFVFDAAMAEHHNPWDSNHIERPERLLRARERCQEMGLIDRCEIIPSRMATDQELLTVHSQEHLEKLKKISSMTEEEMKRDCLNNYHSVYVSSKSFECARLAAGSAVDLTKAVLDGSLQNGMALVRPPGHHAMANEFSGFCLCNNIAIAAKEALKSVNRILIVDFDVHHGQATQYEFYDNPSVVYFSIHRYEEGNFWPSLRESNFDHVGVCGANVNVPLNKPGLGDPEYLAIFHHILMPLAYEFRPELILVSAGYDAALGCPEGQMKVSPATYGHMIHSLMPLAQGKLAVIMEGGYFLESLADGVAMTLRALLADPCLSLGPLKGPQDSGVDSVLNVISALKPHWSNLSLQDVFSISEFDVVKDVHCHVPALVYEGKPPLLGVASTASQYEAGEHYESHDEEAGKEMLKQVLDLRAKTDSQIRLSNAGKTHRVVVVYDEEMTRHTNVNEPGHPERPQRIEHIYHTHSSYGLLDRPCVKRVESRKATKEELLLVHDQTHVDNMADTEEVAQKERDAISDQLDSVYLNEHSYSSALLASGSLLQVVDSVCNNEATSGVAIIRPPGHHAEQDEACGFCMFNNVAIAAKYALEDQGLKRVMILDWDVHHGNGIQNMFYDDPRVLYVSMHRYDGGTFFPGKPDANYDHVGSGRGQGFNVNIPWNASGMGDTEYTLAFFSVVMPVAYQFDPELVLVSAGFDAARGDPLGRCKVSPEMFGHMTHQLMSLANGNVILALEGGYNLNAISLSMTMCTKALLGDPMPQLAPYSQPIPSALESIKSVVRCQAEFWTCLRFGLKLPDNIIDLREQMEKRVEEYIENTGQSQYIPSQFGVYADTFAVNTLSEARLADKKAEYCTFDSKKYHPKMEVETSEHKTKEEDERLAASMAKTSLDNAAGKGVDVHIPVMTVSEATARVSEAASGLFHEDDYIPGQYGSFAGSPGVYTYSSSHMSRHVSSLVTTDSNKTQEDIVKAAHESTQI